MIHCMHKHTGDSQVLTVKEDIVPKNRTHTLQYTILDYGTKVMLAFSLQTVFTEQWGKYRHGNT